MHPSIAISTDIPRIVGLLGSARRTTTKFDRSRPVDSQNDETLGLAGPKLAALPWASRLATAYTRLSPGFAIPRIGDPNYVFSENTNSRWWVGNHVNKLLGRIASRRPSAGRAPRAPKGNDPYEPNVVR
jgi:hypothetical protein